VVQVDVVDAPDRAALQGTWQQWIQEYVETSGKAPPGNKKDDTTWTARKSRAAKPELKLTPGPHKELNVPLTELLDKAVKEIPIIAFIKGTRTAPQCGFSHRVLTILNEHGADYEVVNVLDEHYNPGLREAIKQFSNWPTIPQLYVKGEFVGGADIVAEMAESGEIATLLKKK
jgi:Grx4 family monothiol glutaredoxin